VWAVAALTIGLVEWLNPALFNRWFESLWAAPGRSGRPDQPRRSAPDEARATETGFSSAGSRQRGTVISRGGIMRTSLDRRARRIHPLAAGSRRSDPGGAVTTPTAPAARVTVIKAGRLVDPETGTATPNQVIVVEGRRSRPSARTCPFRRARR